MYKLDTDYWLKLLFGIFWPLLDAARTAAFKMGVGLIDSI